MADNIIRLRVDSSEYDSKLKKASEGLTRYIDGCRKVGGTLEVVEKDTLAYVQALGKMDTTTRTAKGRLGEMTRAFTDLSMQYRNLTSEEKSSPFGQAMSASLDQLKGRIVETKQQLSEIGRSIGDAGMGQLNTGTSSVIQTMGSFSMAIQGVYNGLSTLSSSVTEMTNAYAIQEQAELKLQTIMKQRMNATDEDVDSIKNLAAEQQKLGVIGDEVQLAGAQQVATFLNEKKSIEELLPAMNNLAVQRQGLNVTSEEMVNIGNMVGKVMQGQVGALRRVGITFTEAEEKAIKFGTEEDRAAALANVINNNVGQMNRTLAQTDAGKAKQMSNAFGDMQENIGKALAKWEPFLRGFSQVGMIAMGLGQVLNAVVGVTRAIASLTATQTIANLNNRMATSIVNGLSLAFTGTTVAAGAASTSIKAVTWAIRGLEIATGIGIAIAAVSTAVELLGSKLSDTTSETNNFIAAQDAATEASDRQAASAKRQKEAHDTVTKAVGDVVSKYTTLQEEWKNLKTVGEQTKWIKDNQSAFQELGLRVNNVNDAYSVFVKNAPAVIEALQAIAEADAMKDIYKDAVKQKYSWEHRDKSKATGDYYTKAHAGDSVSKEDIQRYHLVSGPDTDKNADFAYVGFGGTRLSAKGAQNLNAQRNAEAVALRSSKQQEADDRLADAKVGYAEALDKGAKAEATLHSLGGTGLPSTSGAGSGRGGYSGGGGGHTTNTNTTPQTQEQLNTAEINRLAEEYVTASTERQAAIRDEIKKLQDENAEIKRLKDEAQGKVTAPVDPDSLAGLDKALKDIQAARPNIKTHEEFVKWQQDLAEVQKKIDAITGANAAPDLSRLSDSNISAFISNLQKKIQEADWGSPLKDTLTRQLSDAQVFQSLLNEGASVGLDFSSIASQVWQAIANNDNITLVKGAFSDMLEQINSERKKRGENEIDIDSAGSTTEREDATQKVLDKTDKLLSGMSQITGGLQSMGIKVPESVQKILSFGQGLLQVIQGVQTVISVFSTSSQTANTMALTANTVALGAMTTALAVNSTTNLIPFLANGGIVHAANGFNGFVPGASYSGDNIPIMANAGELILNRAQQASIGAQLQDSDTYDQPQSRPYVSGENIFIAMTTYMRRSGKNLGEFAGFH